MCLIQRSGVVDRDISFGVLHLLWRLGIEPAFSFGAIQAEPESREDGTSDLWWEDDQWTQEAVAKILIPLGWGFLGATDPPTRSSDEVPRSTQYEMRT